MPMCYVKIYYDLLEALDGLSEGERGRLITAMLQHARQEDVIQLTGGEKYLWPMVRAQIDRDRESYQETSAKRSKAGSMGGRPAKANENKKSKCFSKNQMEANESKKSQDKDKDKDKEEDKDKDDITDSAEPSSTPPESPIIHLPLNDGSLYGVAAGQAEKWVGLYPAVDVMQELRKMYGWLDSQPKKRKTRAGILKFITNWLAREQDKGGSVFSPRPSTASKTTPENDFLRLKREAGYE